MTITRYQFESGANGDAASIGNTGLDSIVTGAGTAQISTAWAHSGTRSVKFVANTTNAGVYAQKSITAATALYAEAFIYVTGNPTAEIPLLYIGSSTQRGLNVCLTTARELRIRDADIGAGASRHTTTAIPLNTKVKICLFATTGTLSTYTGTFRVAWSQTAPYTTYDSDSGVVTAMLTALANYDTIRIGAKVETRTAALDSVSFDDFGWESGGTNFPISSPPPVLGSNLSQSPYVFLDMSGTTVTTGPVSYSATPSTGVVATSTGLFLPAPTDGTTKTYTVTATDTGNSTNTSTSIDVSAAVGGIGVETVVWSSLAWT